MPNWFDIAQDLTERWVHQMQMREALDKVDGYRDAYLSEVMHTFVWAFPRQYSAEAAEGTQIRLSLGSEACWTLTRLDARWDLSRGTSSEAPTVRAEATPQGAWKWLTGGAVTDDDLRLSGPPDLCSALMAVRAILV